MKRFGRRFPTYSNWHKQSDLTTSYARRIIRLHAIHPSLPLHRLRGHPAKRERPLGKLKKKKVWQLDWDVLTPREKDLRKRSLRAVSLLRREKVPTLSRAAQLAEVRLSPQTIIRNVQSTFIRVNKKWQAKKYDRISRMLAINERGREIYINVKDSRSASLVGQYHAAVKKFLETGNESFLNPFRRKRIKDSEGRWHLLEVNPQAIYKIQEGREEEEFWTIYAD